MRDLEFNYQPEAAIAEYGTEDGENDVRSSPSGPPTIGGAEKKAWNTA